MGNNGQPNAKVQQLQGLLLDADWDCHETQSQQCQEQL
jgi:hypothetical protein